MKVLLTAEEKKLLLDKVGLPPYLKSFILSANENSETEISEDDASELREHCTDTFDLIGFDSTDGPTQEGLVLERLIDKFFIG